MKLSTVLKKIRHNISNGIGSQFICHQAWHYPWEGTVRNYIEDVGCDMSGAFGVSEFDSRPDYIINEQTKEERCMFLDFLIYNLQDEGE